MGTQRCNEKERETTDEAHSGLKVGRTVAGVVRTAPEEDRTAPEEDRTVAEVGRTVVDHTAADGEEEGQREAHSFWNIKNE